MSENNASIAGEAHLNSLRNYIARMSALVSEMDSYALLTLAEFGLDQQNRCESLVRTATIVQQVVGGVTDISEPDFDSLNMSQSLQLTELMNRLEECNMHVLVLVAGLNTAIEILKTTEFEVPKITEFVFVHEHGSG